MADGAFLPPSACDIHQPLGKSIGQVLPHMSISNLPDELLVEIFDWCRLIDECCWNYQRRWFNLLQVCRRWRYIILELASTLRLHILCNFSKHITAFII